jgi:hypothetical protein
MKKEAGDEITDLAATANTTAVADYEDGEDTNSLDYFNEEDEEDLAQQPQHQHKLKQSVVANGSNEECSLNELTRDDEGVAEAVTTANGESSSPNDNTSGGESGGSGRKKSRKSPKSLIKVYNNEPEMMMMMMDDEEEAEEGQEFPVEDGGEFKSALDVIDEDNGILA